MSAGQVLAWWVAGSIAVSAVIVCAGEVDRYLSRRARRKLHESVRRHPAGTRPVTVDDQHWWDHVDRAVAMAHDETPIYDEVADDYPAAIVARLELLIAAHAFDTGRVPDGELHAWMDGHR